MYLQREQDWRIHSTQAHIRDQCDPLPPVTHPLPPSFPSRVPSQNSETIVGPVCQKYLVWKDNQAGYRRDSFIADDGGLWITYWRRGTNGRDLESSRCATHPGVVRCDICLLEIEFGHARFPTNCPGQLHENAKLRLSSISHGVIWMCEFRIAIKIRLLMAVLSLGYWGLTRCVSAVILKR